MVKFSLLKEIKEGNAKILVPKDISKISKDLPVFYNPVMIYNRTFSIEFLRSLSRDKMDIALPLSGTGVRAVRILKELPKSMINKIHINDYDADALKVIKKNIDINKIGKSKISFTQKDANEFLLSERAFDYIDIDPFGSPNSFLNNAIMRLKRKGILAVTATDTAALCGSWKGPCERKYWAKPLHTEEMHEVGLRILIRKVQLIGVQFEKALYPVVSYSKDHYMRVFFLCLKGKKRCDSIISEHGMYKDSGPMWLGLIKDQSFIDRIGLDDDFTNLLKDELDLVGFYDVPTICSKYKFKECKKLDYLINKIKQKGYNASRTQFANQGIKSDISYENFVKLLKSNKK